MKSGRIQHSVLSPLIQLLLSDFLSDSIINSYSPTEGFLDVEGRKKKPINMDFFMYENIRQFYNLLLTLSSIRLASDIDENLLQWGSKMEKQCCMIRMGAK